MSWLVKLLVRFLFLSRCMVLPEDTILVRSEGPQSVLVDVTYCQRAGGRFPVERVAQAVRD